MSVSCQLFCLVDLVLVKELLCDFSHVIKVGAKDGSIIILHIHKLTFDDLDLVATNMTHPTCNTIVLAQRALVTC